MLIFSVSLPRLLKEKMDRINLFLPSIVSLTLVGYATHLYLKWIRNRWHKRLSSIDWRNQNQNRVDWLINMPNAWILAPIQEELIFRSVVIIAFTNISIGAWIGITISAILFGLMHWRGSKIPLSEIIWAKNLGKITSDDEKASVVEWARHIGSSEITRRKLRHVLSATCHGMILGYCGVAFQSLFICVIVHSALNALIIPFLSIFIPRAKDELYFRTIWPIKNRHRKKKEQKENDEYMKKRNKLNSQHL